MIARSKVSWSLAIGVPVDAAAWNVEDPWSGHDRHRPAALHDDTVGLMFGSPVVLAFALAGCGRLGFDASDPREDFAEWTQHRTVVVTSPVNEVLAEFVLPLFIRAPFDYAMAADDGRDLRISDASGALLDHEIEAWSPAATSVVWVRIPNLTPGAQTLTIHAGNPAALAPITRPWTSDHLAVLHFAGNTNDTTSTQVGFATNVAFVPGPAGLAVALSGGAPFSYAGIRASATLDEARTWSGWMRTDVSLGATEFASMIVRPTPGVNDNATYLGRRGAGHFFETLDESGAAVVFDTQETAVAGTWYFLAMTFDGSEIAVYVDGATAGKWPVSGLAKPPTGHFIGADCDSCGSDPTVATSDFLDGAIDEVRIERAVRSPAWLATVHAAMLDQIAVFE